MRQTIFFDLDGVIIDSAQIIRRAYIQAGVEPPQNILAQENVDWLSLQVSDARVRGVRQRKNNAYLQMIGDNEVPLLPAFHAAIALKRAGWFVGLMTAAPIGVVGTLKTVLHNNFEWPFSVWYEHVRTPEKMRIIRALPHSFHPGTYVDDQTKHISLPRCWSFKHYIGQDLDTLYSAITEDTKSCTCA